MPAYSDESKAKLANADPVLQKVMEGVIGWMDVSILNSVRTEAEEAQYVKEGLSETMHSKHLPDPTTGKSRAVDVAPYPQRWDAKGWNLDLIYMGGFIMGYAARMHDEGAIDQKLRYGGDWNRNDEVSDEKFQDLDHIELDP